MKTQYEEWLHKHRLGSLLHTGHQQASVLIDVTHVITMCNITAMRPHHMHVVCRCSLLLQMLHIVWSVVCAKMAEPIKMPFGGKLM